MQTEMAAETGPRTTLTGVKLAIRLMEITFRNETRTTTDDQRTKHAVNADVMRNEEMIDETADRDEADHEIEAVTDVDPLTEEISTQRATTGKSGLKILKGTVMTSRTSTRLNSAQAYFATHQKDLNSLSLSKSRLAAALPNRMMRLKYRQSFQVKICRVSSRDLRSESVNFGWATCQKESQKK